MQRCVRRLSVVYVVRIQVADALAVSLRTGFCKCCTSSRTEMVDFGGKHLLHGRKLSRILKYRESTRANEEEREFAHLVKDPLGHFFRGFDEV